MASSKLVNYRRISPNRNSPRNHPMDRISIHCVVGQCSVRTLGEIFAVDGGASCTYGIGYDGSIGEFCPEGDRSWCTSSAANDHRAITIECASDAFYPYAVNDKVYAALLDLCTDICQRYGKKKLLWFGDKEKSLGYTPKSDEVVLTVHRWFDNKSCPGDYLYNRHPQIAAEVTARLTKKAEEDDYMNKDQIMKELGDKYIKTFNDLPNWAKPAVRELLDKGYINGGTDASTNPDDINMYLSNIKSILVCKRMIEG